MNKQELIHEFDSVHSSFVNYIKSLNEQDFISHQKYKWSAGQQFMHVYLSVKPLLQVFVIPSFVLKIFLGKSNRDSMSYEEVVIEYTKVLEQGGKAGFKYIPKKITFQQKNRLFESLKKTLDSLIDKISKTSDNDLDEILVPHPLMGKLTLREMLYFSIYHAKHHHKIAKQNLINSTNAIE